MKRWLFALLIVMLIHGLAWQFAEVKILRAADKASLFIRGRPASQVQRLDKDGIPYQCYADGSSSYNPLFVAALALRHYRKLPDPHARKQFDLLSGWLAEHATQDETGLWFAHQEPYPKFDMQAPWYSALTQVEVLHLFALRAQESQDDLWQSLTQACARSLTPPSDIIIEEANNALWYVEYPGEAAPYTLNGHCHVLITLHEVWQISKDPIYQQLFERGHQSLVENLPRFDKNGFSLYSAEGELAGRLYHQMVIRQLASIDAIKPHPSLKKYHGRWKQRDNLPVLIQHFYNPRIKRIILFAITLISLWVLAWLFLHLIRLPLKRRR
ncbi:MAG: hypothetical protein GX294_01145 [Candidatus Cloacimonetes bacterium]|nr:hypothetical protein [Candidatus Cloacimonadota bacterium]